MPAMEAASPGELPYGGGPQQQPSDDGESDHGDDGESDHGDDAGSPELLATMVPDDDSDEESLIGCVGNMREARGS